MRAASMPDVRGADLRGANLFGADFARIRGAAAHHRERPPPGCLVRELRDGDGGGGGGCGRGDGCAGGARCSAGEPAAVREHIEALRAKNAKSIEGRILARLVLKPDASMANAFWNTPRGSCLNDRPV